MHSDSLGGGARSLPVHARQSVDVSNLPSRVRHRPLQSGVCSRVARCTSPEVRFRMLVSWLVYPRVALAFRWFVFAIASSRPNVTY